MDLVVAAVIAVPCALVVHEGAHAGVALVLGGRDLHLVRRRLTVGVAAVLPDAQRTAWFFAAGPLASTLAGVIGLCAGGPAALVGLVHLALAATTALGTDGRQAIAALRGNDAAGALR